MVVDPDPADLALEARAVKFMLDYDGAKELEYERLRRAESQEGKDFRRSWLRRAAENLGLSNEAGYDGLPSRDAIDVCTSHTRDFFPLIPHLSPLPSAVNPS